MEPLAQGGGGSSDPPDPPDPPPGYGPATRVHISRRTAEMETPDRPVASHPGGGGGSELGWVEHYRSIQGMVGLSRIMAETRSLAPIAVDG